MPGFDRNGISGGNGDSAGAVSHDFQDANTYQPTQSGATPPIIFMNTAGGNGGNGSAASRGGLIGLRGGSGGNGGDGSTVDASMVAGVVVNATGNSGSAVELTSTGGAGGEGQLGTPGGNNGVAGNGGNAGAVTATLYGTIQSQVAAVNGVVLTSSGGAGGSGASAVEDSLTDGVGAGDGGAAGNVALTFGGTLSSKGNGILARSIGGNGGNGGDPWKGDFPVGAQGGDGGDGGAAGAVSVTFAKGAAMDVNAQGAPGIWAQSFGGAGGAGGVGGGDASGGEAGAGASGATVTIENDGAIKTDAADSPGILAQSFGGAGANGGKGGGWGSGGGSGGNGGDGGTVVILGTGGTIATVSSNSSGILAQSIGGGGGNGGDSDGWVSVGGEGGQAATGGTITVNISDGVNTGGDRSNGIQAQSIGGGGGNGGDAKGTGLSPINLTIGGSSGGGGNGGGIEASSSGLVQTLGAHGNGMLLQSIGGGGGSGGAAYGSNIAAVVGAQVSVGGAGGNGGNGGTIGLLSGAPTNGGWMLTSGADSSGVLAQSIGGGGGLGAASIATALTIASSGDPPVPSVSLTESLGGSGGSGGSGGQITLANGGVINTIGAGSAGIAAQSIGGGGGNGGDSAGASEASGGAVNFSGALTIGGKSGGGGGASNVALSNAGMLITAGESADGMLAQSVGGGGGSGGSGDGQASDRGAGKNVSLALTIGGSGGIGGVGGAVTATSTGNILTLGDGSAGILAQAIGGGGGRGGGGAGTVTGKGVFSAYVDVGGSGGNGGSASSASVTNQGSILTYGADATGIVVQSIGGGGGVGGKAGSSIGSKTSTSNGGNGDSSTIGSQFINLYNEFQDDVADLTKKYNDAVALVNLAGLMLGVEPEDGDSRAAALNSIATLGGASGDTSGPSGIKIGVTVGGRGGGGGDGGSVSVVNAVDSSLSTTGAMSDAILAQSIGGGGGKGGAANGSATATGATVDTAVSVGGAGGSGGNGGSVTVNNRGGIITVGGTSAGIVAQSIGAGGGEGGTSGTTTAALHGVSVSVGGNGSNTGSGSVVNVTDSGSIQTLSYDGIGIIAQSIGGGGGLVKTLAIDAPDNTGGAAKIGGNYPVGLAFDGAAGSNGGGGAVTVALQGGGSITTAGNNAYGIIAQSIGGGGGLIVGGTPAGTSFFPSSGNELSGDADQSEGVNVQDAGAITTTGDGAIGIVAQSVGGGGGFGGNTAMSSTLVAFDQSTMHSGNGGPVAVTVNEGASVRTAGANAPAIYAQSIGGGGGRITTASNAVNGWAGGSGQGGPVNVAVNGTALATGQSSPGIYAESEGQGGAGSIISVSVGSAGSVSGGTSTSGGNDSAGIFIDTGSTDPSLPNRITNAGLISSAGGTAIYATRGNLAIANTGTIDGSINQPGGGKSDIGNLPGGVIQQAPILMLGGGTLTNAGTLDIRTGGSGTNALFSNDQATAGGAPAVGAAALTGNYHGTAGGALIVGANFSTSVSDQLAVSGGAVLDAQSAVKVQGVKWQKSTISVLTAGGGLAVDDQASAAPVRGGYALGLTSSVSGHALQLQTVSKMTPAAAGFSGDLPSVVRSLEQIWDNGRSAFADADGFTALAGVDGPQSYRMALSTLAGSAVGGIAAVKQDASERFSNNLINCSTFRGDASLLQETPCSWMRVSAHRTTLSGGTDDPGYRQDSLTYQIGGQQEFLPGWFVGASLAYEQNWLSGSDDGVTANGQSMLAGLMIKRQTGPWLLTGVLDSGYGWYGSSRQITVGSYSGSAAGSPKVFNVGGHLRVAFQMDMGDWYVEPYATLGTMYTSISSYSESGNTPFNLDVRAAGHVSGSASAMVEVGGKRDLGEAGTLHAFLGLGAVAYMNNNWSSEATFRLAPAGTAPFTQTAKLPAAASKVDLGVDLFSRHGLDLKLTYAVDVAPGFVAQAVMAKLAYTFY